MTTAVLVVGNTHIPYALRESGVAKRKRIIVTPNGVEVVLPAGTASEAAAFVHSKRRWVFDKVTDMNARTAVTPPLESGANGSKVMWHGRNLTMRVALAEVAKPVVVFRSRFDVRLPLNTTVNARPAMAKAAVHTWMRDRARTEAKALVARFAGQVGVVPPRVELRAMARLWGSCGNDNVIRLDVNMMRLPAHLAEYLVAHEVVHLVHRDHSAKFWRLLRTLVPTARMRHEELIAHGKMF
jgi:predicted metal-dependent hydrolase